LPYGGALHLADRAARDRSNAFVPEPHQLNLPAHFLNLIALDLIAFSGTAYTHVSLPSEQALYHACVPPAKGILLLLWSTIRAWRFRRLPPLWQSQLLHLSALQCR